MIELGHVTDRKPPFRYAAFTRVGVLGHRRAGGRLLRAVPALLRPGAHRVPPPARAARDRPVGVRRCARSKVEYVAPARFDDLIEVFVRIARIGRTSVTYELTPPTGSSDGRRPTDDV